MKEILSFKQAASKSLTGEQLRQVEEVETLGCNDPYSFLQLKEMFEDESVDNFICCDGDKIVGFATSKCNKRYYDGCIYIINLVVLPEYRKCGVATQLMEVMTKFYLKKCADLHITLDVTKTNIPAVKLYQKLGFTVPDFATKNKGDDEMVMSQPLTNLAKNIENLKKIKVRNSCTK